MIDQLYRDVYANPDDDDAKHVLADALLALGDPRGELIQLQFSGKHDESGAMRLLQRHGMTWLGSLRGKMIPLGYEKGFLSGCSVIEGCGEAALGCPELSTVTTIELGADDLCVLRDPHLRSLRRVINADREVVAALLALPIAQRLVHVGAIDEAALIDNYARLAALPLLATASTSDLELSRDDAGRLSRLDVQWGLQVVEAIERLPPGAISAIAVSLANKQRQAIVRERLSRFGIPVTFNPPRRNPFFG